MSGFVIFLNGIERAKVDLEVQNVVTDVSNHGPRLQILVRMW